MSEFTIEEMIEVEEIAHSWMRTVTQQVYEIVHPVAGCWVASLMLRDALLKTLWKQLLGELPSDAQFIIWLELYGEPLARIAISKTGMKQLRDRDYFKSLDHRVRFASRVMLDRQRAETGEQQ